VATLTLADGGVTLDDLPAATLFDLLQDAAAKLTGYYAQRHRDAATQPESDAWWQRMLSVRDRVRAVDPDDRPAIIGQIVQLRRELGDGSLS
jgi:hypothetical protein